MVTAARRESLLAQLRAAGVPDAEWDLDQLFYIVLGQHYHALDPAVELSRQAEQRLCELVRRRAERQPLQYLAGEWDFYNITLKVGPGVLIPRPDTEIIVEQALRLLQNKNAPDVLDLCAGTGAIGCAVKHNRPDAKVTGVELSPQAFCYLQENAARYGVKAKLGDVRLFARDCAENSMALIVSNPPYVTQDEYKSLEPELYFEPRMALLAEDNGPSCRAAGSAWRSAQSKGGTFAIFLRKRVMRIFRFGRIIRDLSAVSPLKRRKQLTTVQ